MKKPAAIIVQFAPKMDYEIYFHNDFDGIASAAAMFNFLCRRGDKIIKFNPIDFKIKPKWSTIKFRNPAIIVDFLYHPAATFWFDHHPTTFLKDEWRKKFRNSQFFHWKVNYPSCCHLVVDELVKYYNFQPPRHFKNLIKWLDIIDGANYKSAKQAINKKELALKLAAYIDSKSNDKKLIIWLVEFLSRNSIKKIFSIPSVKNDIELILAKEKEALKLYKENLKVFNDCIAVVDLSGKKVMDLNMAPFYFYPKCLYSLMLLSKGEERFHLRAGINPWQRKKTEIDIGKLMMTKYGGGGHKTVGGANFGSKKEAEKAIKEIVAFLIKSSCKSKK